MKMKRVIGKHALVIAAQGETELAAQVFVYDQLREVRVDTEKFEVRVLMTYDKDYFRVFKVEPNENVSEEQARKLVVEFYNNLLNASMKLSLEELKNLREQENFRGKVEASSVEETTEEPKEEEKENKE